MRRIRTHKDKKKSQKKNQIIIGIILIVVMFGSVFGIIVNSFDNSNNTQTSVKYNGHTFDYSNGLWNTNIGSYVFSIVNKPSELSNVTYVNNTLKGLNSYAGQPLYMASGNNYDSAAEIFRNLNPVVERFQNACLANETCEGNYPIKDCTSNLIIIKESTLPRIYQDNNCVYIEGDSADLGKLTDSFLLKIAGL